MRDVLEVDLHKLICEEFAGMEVAVCANLPYYVTSPILMHLLESRLPVASVTVMVQKEAAQRLCAQMGTRTVRLCYRCCALLQRALAFIPCLPGQLYARAERGFQRNTA